MPALELVMDDKKVHFDRKDHITITGEFDKWQHKEHILQYDDQLHVFKVQLPYSGEEELVFKFVLNGTNWTTVDCFEAITDCQGHVNNRVFCKDWLKSEEEEAEEKDEQVLSESAMTMDDVSIGSPKNDPALSFRVEEVKMEGFHSAPEDENHSGGDGIGELTDTTSVDGGNVGESYNNQYGSHRSVGVSDSSSCSKVCDLSRDAIADGAEASEPVQLNADTHTTSSKAPLSLPGDYIHVASRGELSSSEDVELSPTVTGEEDLRYSPDPGDNRPRLLGLISAIRMFKTYWRG